jgi:hypothetical protein
MIEDGDAPREYFARRFYPISHRILIPLLDSGGILIHVNPITEGENDG